VLNSDFQAGSILAGYRLEAQVGAGGMAVVFRARDERLNRQVALKILAPALASDPEFRVRFIAESRAAATVDDPHIIPVYEAGEADGVLFIAMRFVGDGDLRRVLEHEGPLAPARAAGFISPVASALDAAHRAGLVHRDVKPANILVDANPDRPDHVYLSDFGVSKALSSGGLTGPGHFVGTAGYSAPEQIQGRAVDGRTDQYALACVAFQLLTGTLPFGPDQGTAVLLAHLSDPPPPATARRPDLPGGVDQVLTRAMAKAPEKRYGSCLEFADALRGALGLALYDPRGSATGPGISEPVTSPTLTSAGSGTVDRRGIIDRLNTVTGWIRRHRLAALALAGAILAAAAVIPLVLPSSAKSLSSLGPATSAGPASIPIYTRVRINLPSAYAGEGVESLAFSPPGGMLAVAGLYLCLWDVAANAGCTTNSALTNENSVAFSPDGTTVAAGSGTGRAYLWNAAAKKQTAFIDPGSKGVESVAFSPDGRILAAGDFNGDSYLWDVATGKLVAALADPDGKGVKPVAFSPDGKILAAGDFNDHVYLWNVATRQLITTLADPGGKGVNSVAFSPDGKTLAAGDENGDSYLWDIATGKLAGTLIDPGSLGVNSVAFSPDGKTLAAGDENGDSYLWDIATGKLAGTLIDPGSLGVNSVAFSPRGNTLATGDLSGGLNLWRIS
jgi:eukaryotic-like serine/threonine-protein kinase